MLKNVTELFDPFRPSLGPPSCWGSPVQREIVSAKGANPNCMHPASKEVNVNCFFQLYVQAVLTFQSIPAFFGRGQGLADRVLPHKLGCAELLRTSLICTNTE
jgi:hypothetical protein